jgi:uncharacterized Tic20 family protein
MSEPGVPSSAITSDEKTMAMLAHVLQIVGWWIAPLVIFLIKRESRFVSFHALQALFLQIANVMLMAIFVVAWFAGLFVMVASIPGNKGAPSPIGFFMLFPLLWLGFIALWVIVLTAAVVFGIKAGRGEWAEYPVLGRLARSVLKIGPGGSSL